MIIPNHDYTPRQRTVCDLLAPLGKIRRLLNVGMTRPGDPRTLWWINICGANGTKRTVWEVLDQNCQEPRAAGIPNATCGDVRKGGKLYDDPFDVIMWWPGRNPRKKADVPAVID